jgi:polysaccharide export outer membrane protein
VRVAVLGEVRAPGLFLVDPTLSVTDMVARAGGLSPVGNAKKIMLTKADSGAPTRLNLKAGATSIKLDSGDQIVVGRRGFFGEYGGILVSAGGSVAAAILTAMLLR